jgi:hypothetical protein
MQIGRILGRWLPLAVAITGMSGLVYLVAQQSLRIGANDPQIQMAEDAAQTLTAGGAVEAILPAGKIDLASSIAPFMIVFDESGKVLASSALLNGQTPTLPLGVLDYVRQHGEDRVSWQPAAGVRIAAVVVAYQGAAGGFVLAGRSLREVEARISQLTLIVAAAWVVTLVAALAVVALSEFFMREVRSLHG